MKNAVIIILLIISSTSLFSFNGKSVSLEFFNESLGTKRVVTIKENERNIYYDIKTEKPIRVMFKSPEYLYDQLKTQLRILCGEHTIDSTFSPIPNGSISFDLSKNICGSDVFSVIYAESYTIKSWFNIIGISPEQSKSTYQNSLQLDIAGYSKVYKFSFDGIGHTATETKKKKMWKLKNNDYLKQMADHITSIRIVGNSNNASYQFIRLIDTFIIDDEYELNFKKTYTINPDTLDSLVQTPRYIDSFEETDNSSSTNPDLINTIDCIVWEHGIIKDFIRFTSQIWAD